MISISTYDEWRSAIDREISRFICVGHHYLNDKGKQRLETLMLLDELAEFCDTPEELANWIEDGGGLNETDREYLRNGIAVRQLEILRSL